MSNDLETLFLPFVCGTFAVTPAQKVLFLNAQYHSYVAQISHFTAQQFFKPYAQILSEKNISVVQDFAILESAYDYVLILLPKNMVETKGLIAQGLARIGAGGTFVCAADNKAGGTRLRKLFEEFGLQITFEDSKNKARVIAGQAGNINQDAVQKALNEAGEQQICDRRFSSIAGIFGWDKIDHGSETLVSALSDNITGKGADFGCGYGYLSHHLLRSNPKIKHITCIDADYRAVQMCKKNLAAYEERASFLWDDLTIPAKALRNLDFVIMNPPFHEGKATDSAIGQAFIKNAASVLRSGGTLYMVANRHLPYENILQQDFTTTEKVKETNGFKVLIAQK